MRAETEQPKEVGRAYVDYAANPDEHKVVVWIPKRVDRDCEIWSEDTVEIRTIRRETIVTWGDDDGR